MRNQYKDAFNGRVCVSVIALTLVIIAGSWFAMTAFSYAEETRQMTASLENTEVRNDAGYPAPEIVRRDAAADTVIKSKIDIQEMLKTQGEGLRSFEAVKPVAIERNKIRPGAAAVNAEVMDKTGSSISPFISSLPSGGQYGPYTDKVVSQNPVLNPVGGQEHNPGLVGKEPYVPVARPITDEMRSRVKLRPDPWERRLTPEEFEELMDQYRPAIIWADQGVGVDDGTTTRIVEPAFDKLARRYGRFKKAIDYYEGKNGIKDDEKKYCVVSICDKIEDLDDKTLKERKKLEFKYGNEVSKSLKEDRLILAYDQLKDAVKPAENDYDVSTKGVSKDPDDAASKGQRKSELRYDNKASKPMKDDGLIMAYDKLESTVRPAENEYAVFVKGVFKDWDDAKASFYQEITEVLKEEPGAVATKDGNVVKAIILLASNDIEPNAKDVEGKGSEEA